MNKIIAVVGMAGAGKTSACNFLKNNGYSILRFGDQTDIGLKEKGLPLTEQNEKNYREELRKKLGMAAYAIKIASRIKEALKQNQKIALDGLYSWEEYVYLKKYFPGLILLCIYTRPEIRHKRLYWRKLRKLTKKEAQARDVAELVNLNKGGPIALADYLIENNGPVQIFRREMNQFLDFIAQQK